MKQKIEENWKIVRNRSCIRALLIFMGIVLMQMLAYMVCVVVMTVAAMVVKGDQGAMMKKLAEANVGNREFTTWISLVSALLSLVWCAILYKRSDWRVEQFDYKKAFSVKNISAIGAAGVGICMVLTIVLSFLAAIFPAAFQDYNNLMQNMTGTGEILTVIYVLLIGPISEEFVFRGAIFDRFYLAFPFWTANLLQAALFGIYHMNLIQGLYAFLLGILLGMVKQSIGSIYANIGLHIIFNATSYLIGSLFENSAAKNILIPGILFLLGVALSYVGIRHFVKVYYDKTDDV